MSQALIHTPEASTYAPVILWLIGGCASALASRAHQVVASRRAIGFHVVYAVVLALASAWGITLLGSDYLVWLELPWLVVWCGVGASLGTLAFALNVRSFRKAARARSGQRPATQRTSREGFGSEVRPFRRRPGTNAPKPVAKPEVASLIAGPSLSSLLLVSALEEVVFRGLLLTSSVRLGGLAGVLACVLMVFLFCAGHVHYGFREASNKLPLAMATTVSTLVSGSIAPAVLTHALFNFRVWKANRQLVVVRNMAASAHGMG